MTTKSITQSSAFPPVTATFQDAWSMLTKNLVNFILIGLLNLVVMVVIFAIGAVVTFKSTGPIEAFKQYSPNDPQAAMLMVQSLTPHVRSLVVGGVSVMLISSLVMSALGISLILLLTKPKSQLTLGQALLQSIPLTIPLALLQLLIFFLTLGGFFFFFIPAIMFSFLFMFAGIALVTENTGIFGSLKRSYQVVTQHFGDIFVRLLLFIFAYLFFIIFIPNMLLKIEETTGALVILLRALGNFLIGWYQLTYLLTLYAQASKRTSPNRPANVLWVFVVAALGWALAAVLSVNIGKAVMQSDLLQKLLNPPTTTAEAPKTLVPSSCGISIPFPETTDTNEEVERKWVFEEVSLTKDTFYVLDEDVQPRAFVMGSFIAYKDKDERLANPKQFNITHPGLNVYCIENSKSLSLDEFVNLAKANKNHDVVTDARLKWGEVDVAHVVVNGTGEDGKEFRDTAYLAVSQDKHRLLYMRIWAVPENDPIQALLEADIEQITKHLKYRDVSAKLEEPVIEKKNQTTTGAGSASPTTAGCKQFTIDQGEFASSKCYTPSDYAELAKYVQAFNSAAFDYNGAAAKANVTCGGFTESFKQSCEQAKADLEKAKASMEGYRVAINAVIARGK